MWKLKNWLAFISIQAAKNTNLMHLINKCISSTLNLIKYGDLRLEIKLKNNTKVFEMHCKINVKDEFILKSVINDFLITFNTNENSVKKKYL